ncbi:MAG: 4-aminobutyrate--2-oxoglutarate transaminase [Actinomycetota bacterium]
MNSVSTDVVQERRVVTEIPGPNSIALKERRTKVVSAGVSESFPIYIDRAKGAILVDVDGNHIVDFGGGIGVTTIGHADDAVVEAAYEQARRVTHTLFQVTGYESYVRLCELLAEHTPGDFAKKSVLLNSGAEAVENAVKIARKFTGRPGVAVLDHAYHGRTNLTMSMTFKAMPYGLGFGPFASDVHHAPNSYPFHDGLSGEEAAERTISYLEKRAGASTLACLVVEPIQGEGGFVVPAEGYLPALQKWCNENGIVYVSDEVQSGMIRTGKYYASEHFGLVPDLVCTAKGVAGGFVISAVTGRADIMDASHVGGLGGTFGGNPMSAAAAVQVFEEIEKRDLLGEAQRVGKTLRTALLDLQKKHDIIGDVRGFGAMQAIEFTHPGTDKPMPEVVPPVTSYAMKKGVLLLAAGTYGNVLRFLPAVVTSDELILDVVSIIDEALSAR